MATIEQMALNCAVDVLIEDWNRPEWCEDRRKTLVELAGMIALERRVNLGELLRMAKDRDPYIGLHWGIESENESRAESSKRRLTGK